MVSDYLRDVRIGTLCKARIKDHFDLWNSEETQSCPRDSGVCLIQGIILLKNHPIDKTGHLGTSQHVPDTCAKPASALELCVLHWQLFPLPRTYIWVRKRYNAAIFQKMCARQIKLPEANAGDTQVTTERYIYKASRSGRWWVSPQVLYNCRHLARQLRASILWRELPQGKVSLEYK